MANEKTFQQGDAQAVSPPNEYSDVDVNVYDIVHTGKTRWQRMWPAFACGAGLFSDGYLQSAIGPVLTILKKEYPKAAGSNAALAQISSIAFAGTVVGQLVFGYTSDHWSRKWSLMISTVILIIFAALGAGAYGAGGSVSGLISALIAYRFLLGIGIGGEYPAGSVGCAESTGELKEGTRNRWFVMFTNVQIDFGFVMGQIIPMIIAAAAPKNLGLIWRLSLGLGCVFPLSLFYLRLKYQEPESTKRNNFRSGKTPYWLALKFYGFRLLKVMAIWFIYDFLTYPFSIYSSTWLTIIAPNRSQWQSFGWSALINFFYLPGALVGAWVSDWIGPRKALMIFVVVQGVIGFAMAGAYGELAKPSNVGGFVVLYGFFLAFGEVGPGDNIGLIAAKSSSTGIRGQYYAIAAAFGKIGGFIGNYIFPYLIDAGGSNATLQGQYPFYLASSLCFVSALLVFFLPEINQDTIEKEDIRFREYLEANGFDTTQMGNVEWQDRARQASMVQHETYQQEAYKPEA